VICYQGCESCSAQWYFERPFCPRCGSQDPRTLYAQGLGTVYAATLVHRAPSIELRRQVPYLIVLVAADEGFRVMGRGERDLVIGERVHAQVIEIADQEVPFFSQVRAD
jgi:uncharacterized protein